MAWYGKGLLITVEGIDGSGKSTQAGALKKKLEELGYDVVLSSEPTGGRWGKEIARIAREGRNGISVEEELELFMKDRREHVRDVIEPGLEKGAVVILDRYYYSSVAYQGGRGLDVHEILKENERFAPRPDIVFILTIDPEIGIGRIVKERGEEPNAFERLEDLKKVESLFESMNGDHIVKIRGDLSEEEVHQRIFRHVRDLIERRKGNEI